VAWFVWLTLSLALLGFILNVIGSPLQPSAATVGTTVALAVLMLSGALGAMLARSLPHVHSAPFGPSGMALLVGLAGAQLRFASQTTEAAMGGLGTLLPVWLAAAVAVLLGELVALLVLQRRQRTAA
jgi:heme exporter protein D